jgi:hypothetical protein
MPNWLLQASNPAGLAVSAGATRFAVVAGDIVAIAAESATQAMTRGTYTLSQLFVRVTANATAASSTVRSRKNGSNGAQSVSIGAGATGVFQDTVNSDSLLTGDLINSQETVGAGGSLTISIISYILAASTDIPILLEARAGSGISHGATAYCGIGGGSGWGATESDAQYVCRVSSTLSNFYVCVYSNSCDGATTFRVRKNGADGNENVSVPATTTGAYEDATNSDSVASGDTLDYSGVAGGTAGTIYPMLAGIKSSSAGRQLTSSLVAGDTVAYGTTVYYGVEGKLAQTATETKSQGNADASFTAKNLFVRVPTNSVNGDTTFILRKGAANTALTVTVGASTTGTFEDTSDTVSCVAADLLDWGIVTGGSSGTMVITVVGFELAQPGASQKSVADALALGDAIPGVSVQVAVAEGLGLADALPAGTPKALLGLAEGLTLSDVLAVRASLALADALALAEMVSSKQFKGIADSLALADQVAMAVLVVRLLVLASLLKEGLAMFGTAGPSLTLSATSGMWLQLESTMKGG